MTRGLGEVHYFHLTSLLFFRDIIDDMISGPVIYLILEGEQVVELIRKMIGRMNQR